ncbi:OLC1v1006077C1 [Oldenlandia corymbosa var. corymbosa]|uniref:OLC1v1006077C1 n=1 Tax=Oldenlandia corymbosa var. corymbosa TaxID=529605 RepID=A0AAV1DG47_OLDCO|nr:OLC1v1006077C1 [Oldenlandia corymbosa var. corymbosa]
METHLPKSKSKPSMAAGKSPSRLQKCAPAALRLDAIRTGSTTKGHHSSSGSSSDASSSPSSLGAIPLLSPIALLSPFLDSPPPRLESEADSAAPVFARATDIIMGAQDMVDQVQGPPTPVFGAWQHPAASAEPPKLFALFHSQCSLVNPTQ